MPSSNVVGTQAKIQARAPRLCSFPILSTSAAWVMIAPPNQNGWAQVGYWRQNSYGCDCLQFFVQYKKNAGANYQTLILPGSVIHGFNYKYAVARDNSDGLIHFWLQDIDYVNTSWDPYDAWAQPFRGPFSSETTDLSSDFPGVSDTPEYFIDPRSKSLCCGWAPHSYPTNWQIPPYPSWSTWQLDDVTDGGFHSWTVCLDHQC